MVISTFAALELLNRYQQILLSLQIQQKTKRFESMPRPKVQRNGIKYKYSKHEIVWAKTAGYRWWPASITSLPSKNKYFYKVDFIGDRSYALLAEQKLAPYLQLRDQYEANKKNDKHFINAVTIAAKKYDQWLVKQAAIMKSKGSVECKTSQQKQQLNKQIQLPLIPENIQQISSLNQQLYLCSANEIPNLNNESHEQQNSANNMEPSHEQAIQRQAISSGRVQSSQDLEIQILEQEDRQKLIEQLLTKYKLHSLPELRQFKKCELQKSEKDKKKLHWKRKPINKRRQSARRQEESEFSQQDQLTRKIYRYLLCKLHSVQECRIISLSLKDQIIREKIQKVECLRKVVEWIGMTEQQNIMSYHAQWINFYKDSERQRQKHSNLTMEDESQELSIK